MDPKEYKDSMNKLIKWGEAYYRDDAPTVSDQEYDTLYHKIKKYHDSKQKENGFLSERGSVSVLDKIGGDLKTTLSKAKHCKKMYSMDNVFTNIELEQWIKNTFHNYEDFYLLEYKYDGLSLNLIYENGVLMKAITRGDGEIGEIVTSNIVKMSTIPKHISEKRLIEIRGEICLPFKDFQVLNLKRAREGKKLFANVRNAAAGLMRTLGNEDIIGKHLTFHPWGLGEHSKDFKSQSDIMSWLGKESFKIDTSIIVKDVDNIEKMYNIMSEARLDLDFAIDGMVIKTESIAKQKELGFTVKVPKWSIAYKFPAMELETKILSVVNQIGRTGTITPVALVRPVNLDGALVSRVTLHNYSEIAKKDIRINDIVKIIRSGDVIPKIISVVTDKRRGKEIIITPPLKCPDCGGSTIIEENRIYCNNPNCKSQIVSKIAHFASRDYMNIVGLGEKVVEQLLDSGLVKDVKDLYTLTLSDLYTLEGFKKKSSENLLTAIHNSKGMLMSKLLSSLNIPNVGRTISKAIVEELGLKFLTADVNTLIKIPGLGDEIAISLVNYLSTHKEYLEKFIEIIKPVIDKKIVAKDNIFKNKTIVITGSFNKSRNDIKKLIEDRGGKVSSSITANTDILLYGEGGGGKLAKAKELNITLMNKEELNNSLKKEGK